VLMMLYQEVLCMNGFIRWGLNCKHCIELGEVPTIPPYFSRPSVLKDEICKVLKKQRTIGQPLYVVCIQSLIKATIINCQPQLLESRRDFWISLKWTKTLIKIKLN
jgi:hypothetical protein